MHNTSSPLYSGGAAMGDGSKSNTLQQFLHQLSGQEKEPDIIMVDHSYARFWSAHVDSQHAKPARMLFMKILSRQPLPHVASDVIIDVDTVPATVVPAYDNPKTRSSMADCDRFLKNSMNQDLDEQEDRLNKAGWTTVQNRLYKQTVKVIQGSRLARLAYEGTEFEAVRRRVAIDKAARRIRQVFSAYSWDMTLLSWLHPVLMNSLNEPMLSEYFEILRTLKAKIPNLIDKLLNRVSSFHTALFGSSCELFNQLLKKPWDPVISVLNQQKPKKLPGNALILVVPSTPNQPPISSSHRMRFWNSQLSSLGKVMHVSAHSVAGVHRIALDECLDQIFSITRNKVIELKNQSPNRPIILFGWMTGALIACHVALEEAVSAVVCFGFPLTGVGGSRGDLDDPLLDSKVPTLFVIGQNASTCSMDDIEDFRERMKTETGLVVIGGADDMLRVSAVKKKVDGVTQSMVDRCLVDEVSDFLSSVLSPQYPSSSSHGVATKRSYPNASSLAQEQSSSVSPHSLASEAKRKRRKPREYSPEISPVRRKTRQVNRPNAQKVSTSSSSSETSSIGSCASENSGARKEVKKKARRKVGRPSTGVLRKRSVSKVVRRRPKTSVAAKKDVSPLKPDSAKVSPTKVQPVLETGEQQEEETAAAIPGKVNTGETSPSDSKLNPLKALALVNQQKNAPVDVEKAFGKDSSFLPRPLTPPDLVGEAISVAPASPKVEQPTEPVISEASSVFASVLPKPKIVSVSPSSLANLLASPGQKISFLKPVGSDSPLTTFSTHVSPTVAIQKPQVVAKIAEPVTDSNKGQVQLIEKLQYHNFPLTSTSLISTKSNNPLSSTKIISASGLNVKSLQSQLTAVTGKSLQGQLTTVTGKSLLSPTSSQPQTIFMTSSTPAASDSATYLVSTQDSINAGGTKTIHLRRMVVKGSSASSKISLLPKIVTTTGESESNPDQPMEQQACNLSLLSDVAGMKEPIPQTSHEIHCSTNATLVKLSSSKIAGFEGQTASVVKRIRLTEPVSSPQRLETPEEQAEKQMAIRALSSSFNDSKDVYPSRNPNYTICYPRSDGSILPRSSSAYGYSLMMPHSTGISRRPSSRRGRGRPAGMMTGIRRPRMPRTFPSH